MDAIVILLISLSIAFFLSRLCARLSLPALLGPLLTGIVFSIPKVQEYVPINNISELFTLFSDLGIILLLFYIGLKINIHKVKQASHDVTSITLLSTFIPVILTFLLVSLLGYSWAVALSIAAVLAVSDESVSLVLLEEAKLVRTKVGQLIISTGVLDDVLSVIFVGILTIVFTSSMAAGAGILRLLLEVAILVIFLVLLHYVIIPYTHRYYTQTHFRHKYDLFTVTLILVLLLATFSHYLHFGFAIGSLLAGIIVRSSFDGGGRKGLTEEREIDDMFRTLTFGFVIFFFFIAIGLHINFSSLDWLLICTLVIIGLFGKWFGALLGYRLVEGKSSFRLANLIGWGLGSRGAMALIVLEIARANDIIPASLFSSVVFVAVITTIIAPIVFRFFVKQRAHHFKSRHL